MQISKTQNNTFGLKLSYSMQEQYARIHGVRHTKKLIKKLNKMGFDKLIITDFQEISLNGPYNASLKISDYPINLTSEKFTEIQKGLIGIALRNNAKKGQLLATADKLYADFDDMHNVIIQKLTSPRLMDINYAITQFKQNHPILYKLGARPNIK